MSLKESFLNALNSIYSNKSRNLLSMFGIVVGISFVIVIMSLGSTVQIVVDQLLQGQASSIATVLVAMYDKTTDEQKVASNSVIENFERNYSDLVYDVLIESPQKAGGYFVVNEETYLTDKIYSSVDVSGVSKGYERYDGLTMIKGRFINDLDCSQEKSSVVISDISAKAMFGTTSCIGETVKLISDDNKRNDFVVVGVYHYIDKTGSTFEDYNKVKTTAYTSYSFMNKIYGNDVSDTTWKEYLKVIPVSDDCNGAASVAAKEYFQKIYSDVYDDNCKVYAYPIDAEDETGLKAMPTLITGVFLAIAMISLIVGGIGVMNINLINITEKTQEIGICKALGAKNRSIALQFLLESVIVCVIAGVVGVLVGFGLDILIQNIIPNLINHMPDSMNATKSLLLTVDLSVQPSMSAVIVSFVITVVTGVIFGVVPATKASKMVVVDALRYE